MRSNFKINAALIISFAILMGVLLFNYVSYKEILNDRIIKTEQIRNDCLSDDNMNSDKKKFCESVLENDNKNGDFYTAFTEILIFGFRNFAILLFLFIVIPSLIYTSRYLKSKVIVNELTRTDYKKILKKYFLSSYKSVIILPIIIIIAFVLCYSLFDSFDYSYSIANSTIAWSEQTIKNPIIFMLLYLLNSIVHSFLYINISLCIVRKHHNFLVSAILSFLTFIGIEAVLELLFNAIICTLILKTEVGIIFNIMNILAFNDLLGIFSPLIVPTILLVLSFIILFVMYKDKEKLIIDCEANV